MLLNQIINFVLLASGMLVDYATKMISQQNDNLLSSSPPQHDPLLLWLSGGPGCSSLFGVCGEIGPILIDTNGKLTFNPYFWNQKTNFLFIKSPAGAGFSYRTNFTPPYQTNDNETVFINYHALQLFYAKYPLYIYPNLFLAGQSYAAHYVSQLGELIVRKKCSFKLRVFLFAAVVTTKD